MKEKLYAYLKDDTETLEVDIPNASYEVLNALLKKEGKCVYKEPCHEAICKLNVIIKETKQEIEVCICDLTFETQKEHWQRMK